MRCPGGQHGPAHEQSRRTLARRKLFACGTVRRRACAHALFWTVASCAPNTLLHEDGSWSGHVDMGALGLADRWAGLAVATWSTEWIYGPGWENALLDAYGVSPDPGRIDFYRRLWEAT